METKINILFYGKKTKKESDKILIIYLRVTINGERFEVSTGRSIDADKWSQTTGKAKGNTEEARNLNAYLDIFKNKVYEYQKSLLQHNELVSKENFRLKWFGIEEKKYTLVEVFQNHNKQLEKLIGKDNSKATFTKYRTTLDHLISFLHWKYKKNDIQINCLNYQFITDFEFWLKSIQNCNHNTTIKYISNLRKIINICLKNGWLNNDPFVGFKMTKKEVIREILSEEELQRILAKNIENARLRQVRDIFVFSCFTGLAYIDSKKLKRSEIVIGTDGDKWIYTNRKKTDSPMRIPLLPVVLDILEIYKDHPQCVNKGFLLPVPSNANLNAYLKEVADICDIQKHLTFHIARHTFATTVTLNNGVPMESVSKMLGHKSIKITQIYAKILDRKVSEDMRVLKNKFPGKIDQNLNTT